MPFAETDTILASHAPLVQYSSGKTVMRLPAGTKSRFAELVGFHSEAHRYEDLDAACAAAGVDKVDIRHQNGEEKVHHYFGEKLTILPVTTGPSCNSVFRLGDKDNAARMAAAGIGAAWTTDAQGRPRSKVAVRCFVPILMAHGYRELVQLIASSTMSDRLLEALADHMRACKAAGTVLGTRVRAPEMGLPLGAGTQVTVGKSQQMTLVPFVSLHPKILDRAYIDSLYHSDGVMDAVDEVWDAVLSWAEEYGAASQTKESSSDEAPTTKRASAPTPSGLPADFYWPGPEDIEACIKQATNQEHLEAYRQHLLDMRDRREISAAEQLRLAALLEDRLNTVVGVI
jgi:hypothetical protein